MSATSLDDERFQQGLRDGWLIVDTRLRDALRMLAGGPGMRLTDSSSIVPRVGATSRLDFPAFDLTEQAAHAADAMSLADPVDRTRLRIDSFEHRLAALERPAIRRVLSRR